MEQVSVDKTQLPRGEFRSEKKKKKLSWCTQTLTMAVGPTHQVLPDSELFGTVNDKMYEGQNTLCSTKSEEFREET